VTKIKYVAGDYFNDHPAIYFKSHKIYEEKRKIKINIKQGEFTDESSINGFTGYRQRNSG
jgi:hypothetical protein